MNSSPRFNGAHRPWPVPDRRWIMFQRWHDLLFAHWPLPPATLQEILPAGLELDTFDSEGWVGVVPFRMSGIRLRGTPAVPRLSAFPELNVRTYVRIGDRPGVWFFSLDARNPIAVAIARRWFHLPYFRARMNCQPDGDSIVYSSRRTHREAPEAALEGSYGPTGPVNPAEPGTLEHWLTERYCLYAQSARGNLLRGEIDHAPWPLQPARADLEIRGLTEGAGMVLPDREPLLHFSRRLDVRCWAPIPAERVS